MKFVIAICCATMLVTCQEASAATPAVQPVDFSTMSCEQFWQRTPASDRGPFLFWLSGYFGHKKNSSVLDEAKVTEKTKALSDYCAKQPNDNVLSAAAKAFSD
jgi:HdeA/HdeB family